MNTSQVIRMSTIEKDVINTLCNAADQLKIRASETSTNGALMSGALGMLGGQLFGPQGVDLGNILGGFATYSMGGGNFKPLAEILRNNFTEEQKIALIRHLKTAVNDIGILDLRQLTPLLTRYKEIREDVLEIVMAYLRKHLGMHVAFDNS